MGKGFILVWNDIISKNCDEALSNHFPNFSVNFLGKFGTIFSFSRCFEKGTQGKSIFLLWMDAFRIRNKWRYSEAYSKLQLI